MSNKLQGMVTICALCVTYLLLLLGCNATQRVTISHNAAVVLRSDQALINSLAFSPESSTLASGDGGITSTSGNNVKIWNLLQPNQGATALQGHIGAVNSVSFSPDGRTLASGSQDKTVRLWSTDNLRANPVVLNAEAVVYSVAFSLDGQMLAAGCDDDMVRIWKLDPVNNTPTLLSGHTGPIYAVSFSPDGRTLASGSQDKTVRLWSTDNLRMVPTILSGQTLAIKSVAFSPDGQTLASASYDGTVFIYNVRQPNNVPITLDTRPSGAEANLIDFAIRSVAFSPDGQRVATGSLDGKVRLWATNQSTKTSTIIGEHQRQVNSVIFSPDGSTLASASDDGTIRLWNVKQPILPQTSPTKGP